MNSIDLELALGLKLGVPTVDFLLHPDYDTHLLIWTWEFEPEQFALVARLVRKGLIVHAWSDTVRDYIDMTHVRNWLLGNCKDYMTSEILAKQLQFMARYKYERAPLVSKKYVVI